MAFTRADWIWFNGKLVAAAEATTHVASHALHYGTSVIEGMRCYETARGPAVFRGPEHWRRFLDSARAYGWEIPYSGEQLAAATAELIRRNGFGHCYIRPVSFYGAESLGLRGKNPVETAILAWANLYHSGAALAETGLRATVSRWRRFSPDMMPPTAKAAGHYLNSLLAAREASERGFDEALLLNEQGDLAEASVANIFLVQGGVVRTNDSSASALGGITQDTVVALARADGLPVEIGRLRRADLEAAEEVFLTGTAAELLPVREVDGRAVGGGGRGAITARLQRAYQRATRGEDERFERWLAYVDEPAAVARQS